MKQYGYIRVSSIDQNIDRQIDAMKAHGIETFFVDKQSGKDFERPAWKNLSKIIKKGDLLCVTSLDRMGRNYEEVQEQWRWLVKEKGADIVVLDMPLLDTRKNKDLLGTLITDLVLQLLAYVAQNEREMIRKRQAEGIAAAKARGVKFGKKPIELPENFEEVIRRKMTGEISWKEAGRILGIAPSSCHYRAVREFPDLVSGHPPHNKTTLEEYRARVAEFEAEAARCKRLYEQTGRLEDRDRWDEAKLRASGARGYLKKREKQEAE